MNIQPSASFGGNRPIKKKASSSSSPFPVKKKKRVEEEDVSKKKARPVMEEDDEDDSDTPHKKSSSLALTSSLGGTLATVVPKAYVVATILDEGEDNEERYKNRRKNTASMIVPTQLLTQASQHEVRGLTTMFGQRANTILNLLESDAETDGALTLLQRSLLQTMVDVLPVVERGVRTSHGQRGVYQLNQCVSQIRELTSDIQALRSRGQLGAAVVERVMRPAFMDLAMQVQLAMFEIDNSVKTMVSEDNYKAFNTDTLQYARKNLALYMQNQFEEIKDQVMKSLS